MEQLGKNHLFPAVECACMCPCSCACGCTETIYSVGRYPLVWRDGKYGNPIGQTNIQALD
jgi:hypothetical protein